jgi:hypothetical protein
MLDNLIQILGAAALIILAISLLPLLLMKFGIYTGRFMRFLDWFAEIFLPLFWSIIIVAFLLFIASTAGLFVASKIGELGVKLNAEGSPPFYLAGLVGFVLLAISTKYKHVIIGTLGAGLVAAAFSHWVGPITFPK